MKKKVIIAIILLALGASFGFFFRQKRSIHKTKEKASKEMYFRRPITQKVKPKKRVQLQQHDHHYSHAPTIIQASHHQYGLGSPAGCAFMAAGFLSAIQANPNINIESTELLDSIIKEAASRHTHVQAGYLEEAAKAYNLDIVFPMMLHHQKGSIINELKGKCAGERAYPQAALIQNGIECWALFIKSENEVYIFDSHTKTHYGLNKAYVIKFASIEDAVYYIEEHNSMMKNPELFENQPEHLRQQSMLAIYWIS